MKFDATTPLLPFGTEVIWNDPSSNEKIPGKICGYAQVRQAVIGAMYIIEICLDIEVEAGVPRYPNYPYTHIGAFEVHLELDKSAPGGMSWADAALYR